MINYFFLLWVCMFFIFLIMCCKNILICMILIKLNFFFIKLMIWWIFFWIFVVRKRIGDVVIMINLWFWEWLKKLFKVILFVCFMWMLCWGGFLICWKRVFMLIIWLLFFGVIMGIIMVRKEIGVNICFGSVCWMFFLFG